MTTEPEPLQPRPASDPERIAMTSVALDGRVELELAAARLARPEPSRYPYARLGRLGDGARLYVFRFGAVVVEGRVGLDEEARAEVERLTERRCLLETSETWYVRPDPAANAREPRVGWDTVVLPARTPDRMAAVALLLGQSAALERYERTADTLLDEASRVAHALARQGRPPHRTRTMVRRLGRITADRLELARWFFLVDRPDETWESAEIAALYDALFRNLELRERHQAMLYKLETAEAGMQHTVELWQVRWSHWLEWAIVLLIVFDIAVVLLLE